jgi:4-hydroxy-tetrahydrodipicolinate synthase
MERLHRRLFESGAASTARFAAAREIHARLLPLMLANFAESNPIPVKAAMAQMGLLEETYRLPMVPPRAETREKLRRALAAVGALAAEARP